MTLCAAWVRHGQNDEGQELVFATDSRLRMGEAWDSGLKLFDLGRADCLLCFAGDTRRAYPLILQGGSLQRFSVAWSDPRLDVYDVLDSLTDLFTEVCRNIDTSGFRPAPPPLFTGDEKTDFLFGGWSWRRQKFGIWKLHYSHEAKGYVHAEITAGENEMRFTFMGDHEEDARGLLQEEIISQGKVLVGVLDMEPLVVLSRMSEDARYPEIGGSLQVAKVYRSGHHEFFGVKMPSGKTAVLGRDMNPYDAPPMRFIDLQQSAKFTDALPPEFVDTDDYNFGVDTQFIRDCYPNCKLKSPLPEAERNRLQRIFKDHAYRDFLKQRNDKTNAVSRTEISEDAREPALETNAAGSILEMEEGATNG